MASTTTRSSSRLLSRMAVAAWILGVVGCAASSPRDWELGPDESFDGLRAVTNARVSAAWIKPDLDLSGYTKILPVNAGVEYRPARNVVRGTTAGSRDAYAVPADVRERFEALVTEVFREELAKSERFQTTSEPGPDTLMIVGGLLDVVSRVPPEPIGRGNIYLSEVGEATLVLELRDSETRAILARVLDRRAAEKNTGATWSNPVSNAADVRRLIRQWATRLRVALDEVPSMTPADD